MKRYIVGDNLLVHLRTAVTQHPILQQCYINATSLNGNTLILFSIVQTDKLRFEGVLKGWPTL